jgi:hypothetical protein
MHVEGVRFREGEKVIRHKGAPAVYRCDTCDAAFVWDDEPDGPVWFGSLLDQEECDFAGARWFCCRLCATVWEGTPSGRASLAAHRACALDSPPGGNKGRKPNARLDDE